MPRKTIIIFTLKDYGEQEIISDSLEYAVELINTFRDKIYKPMTKSNLNNILRGVAPIPPYIQNIYNEIHESTFDCHCGTRHCSSRLCSG